MSVEVSKKYHNRFQFIEYRTLDFRKDINGLRAIAVILVMLFHFNKSWLPGGFAGVDMFLVISGYLITNILINKKVLLVDFYIKRIKRILPNTYVVITFSLVIGYFISFPNNYRTDALSSFFSVFYLANVRFAFLDDYFNPSHISPLLHLWSLSLEEQFYILFPLIFVFTKSKAVRIGSVILLMLLSIFFIFYLSPQLSYYLLPSRMFGLLLGAVIALSSFRLRNSVILSYLVLLLFIYILFYDVLTEYVVIIASIITAIIITTSDSAIHKALNSKALNKIGELSFSLYLWHWPIIAFATTLEIDYENSLFYLMLYLLFTFSFSYITKVYVEDKFRYYKGKRSHILVFFLLVPMFILGSISLYIFKNDGVPQRYNLTKEQTRTMMSESFDKANNYQKLGPALIVDVGRNKENILLVGDSHSGHFVDFFKRLAERNVIEHNIYWAPAGAQYYNSDRLNTDILTYGEKAVVFATRIDNRSDDILKKQIDFLNKIQNSGVSVYIIAQVPRLDGDNFNDQNFIKNYIRGKIPLVTESIDNNYHIRNYLFNEAFNFLDFTEFFLINNKVKLIVNGKNIYMDDDHINSFGSKWLADECLNNIQCQSDIEKLLK